MDEEAKRRAKQAIRAKERATARAAFPLDPLTLADLFRWVDEQLRGEACDYTLRHARIWLDTHGHDTDRVVAWLEDNGGYCDCEVGNVEGVFEDALRVVMTRQLDRTDFAIAQAVAGHDGAAGQDRIALVETDDAILIALADGAGGTGAGGLAADLVVKQIESAGASFDPASLLAAADKVLRPTGGESTGIFLRLSADGITGASVGDSEVWLVRDQDDVALTAFQTRKPLLGSGHATPRTFASPPLKDTLVIATDGLFKYARRERLLPILRSSHLPSIPQRAVNHVRLPPGNLQDDVAIVVCRPKS